jgi:outer membrane receptor protein involved in Fe transport
MKKILLLFFCHFLIAINIFPGVTGKLTGKVTDKVTGEPLPLVNVVLDGTTIGAATDNNGVYMINNIPPGTYAVIFSSIGFAKSKVINVQISADFTTKIDASLSSETVTTREVIVEAKAPLIRNDLTSSHTTIEAAQIQKLPVESVTQILTLQAGVTQGVGGELHIRGGRSNEIAYTVNGISIADPFNNSQMISIATNAIQELSVISGTFNAEYGNAMSGIVNTVTKEGGNSLKGQLSFYTGDYLSTRKDIFFNIDDIDPMNTYVGEFSLGGPIPLTSNLFSFFASGRYENGKGWLYGIREHNPTDSIYISRTNPNDIQLASTGDGKIVPMSTSESFNGTFKLTYKPLTNLKINYDLLVSLGKSKGYDHDYMYNPEALGTSRSQGYINSLELRHAIDSKTFYTVKGSYNLNYGSDYLYPLLDQNGNEVTFRPGMDLSNLHADPRYQPDFKNNSTYFFVYGGTDNSQSYSKSQSFIGKFDIVSQISQNHEIKVGFEYRGHILEAESFTIRRDTTTYLTPTILGLNTAYHSYYKKKPVEFAAYIQDKMEYSSIIVNFGIRYDYFNAHSQYSTNTLYPSPNDPSLPSYIDKNSLLADADAKQQISPRLGISFPITDKGIIHFSYGHFFQMPSFTALYTNSMFKYSYATGDPLMGNANLNPQKTVSYEIGVQQQLSEDVALVVTGFYKDVRDLLSTQSIRVSGDKTYQMYVNKDYGNIKGITVTLTKRRTAQDMFGATIDYTYQTAEGNNTNSDAFFLDISSGRQAEKEIVNLGWDQTHTLNATVIFGEIGNWNVSLVGRLGSGMPYTPQIYDKQVYIRTNSGTRPSTTRVDLFADKMFTLFGVDLSIFLKIFNLFDTKNERYVFSDTGRSTYTLQAKQGGTKAVNDLAERLPGIHTADEYYKIPSYYYAPREVRVGASIEF